MILSATRTILVILLMLTTVSATAEISAVSFNGLNLTAEERDWLKQNPHIRFATLVDQAPFSMQDKNGRHAGIMADIFTYLGQQIGQELEHDLFMENEHIHQRSRKKGNYGTSSIFVTAYHQQQYLYSKPYFQSPFYVITKKNNLADIRQPQDLRGKRVVIPRGHRALDEYLDKIGGVEKVIVDSPLAQMQKVIAGEADALLGYITYPILLDKYLMSDLVPAFVAKSDMSIHIGVNPEFPILKGILDKAIATLSKQQIQEISAKWTHTLAQTETTLPLTAEEKSWLRDNPIVDIGVVQMPPYQFSENGQITGYQVEMMRNLLRRASLQARYQLLPLAEMHAGLRKGQFDIAMDIFQTPEREEYLAFAERTIEVTVAIFAQTKRSDIFDLASLKGKTIASYQGYGLENTLKKLLPDSRIVRATDVEGMLRLVAAGKADFCLQEIRSGEYALHKGFITNVEAKGISQLPGEPTRSASEFVVRKDLPVLKSILDKADRSMNEAEIQHIWNRWFTSGTSLSKPGIQLNDAERAWLEKKNTVRVRIRDWPPFMYVKPEPSGIAVDYIKAVARKAGFTVEFIPDSLGWPESLDDVAGQRQYYDLIPVMKRTAEREKDFAISEDYLFFPWVIISRDDSKFIGNLQDLYGKTIAVERGFVMQKKLSSDYPDILTLETESSLDALQAVASGQADAYIGNLANATYLMQEYMLDSLKVVSPTPFDGHDLAMAVRKDWPELASIVNKALASIMQEEHKAIRNRWLSIRYEQGLQPKIVILWIAGIVLLSLLIVSVVLYWNRRLSGEVAARIHTEQALNEANLKLQDYQQELEQRIQERTAELATSEEQLAMVLEGGQQGFWDWNIETGEVQRNDRWAQMLGYDSIKEFEDTVDTWTDNIYPEDRDPAWAAINEHLEGRSEKYSHKYRMFTKDGEVKWILDHAKIVKRDADGKPLRMCGMHTDITELKRAEQEKELLQNQLQHAQKIESLGQLTGGIAHDFNNLLGVINGYADLAYEKARIYEDTKLSTYLNSIKDAGSRAAALVSQMMLFSRSKKVDDVPLKLSLLLKDELKMLRSTLPTSIEIMTEIEQGLPGVLMDPTQLNQILMNLAINARDAMDGVGILTVKLKWVHGLDTESSVTHKAIKGDWIELSVKDNGSGIEPEVVNNIFNPFFTTKEVGKGTGMGLSVIYRIMENHHGHILLESKPGEGSNFRLLFPPLLEEASYSDNEKTYTNIPAGNGSEILVVDDESMLGVQLSEVLMNAGYRAHVMTDSMKALELIEKEPERFSLLITDQTMPKMTGVELISRVREERPGLPVIICSGYSDKIDENSAAEMDIRYIQKPVSFHALLLEIASQLGLDKYNDTK